MFGLGKKDEDGKQVRIEHRGKYTRASRTGGVAVRGEKKVCAVSAPLIWQVPDLLLFWDDPPEFLIGGSDGGWW